MPRKKAYPRRRLTPRQDYWMRYLESQNIIGEISQETEGVLGAPTPAPPELLNLTPDQIVFCYRVAERLTPIDGLDRNNRRRVLEIRKQTRQELERVFKEKEDVQTWFTRTRQKFNIMEHELIEIMYEALEGLRSEEAKELKQQLGGVYKQLVRMRTIGPTG